MRAVTLPFVALSAEEAACALRRAGFQARNAGDRIVLERGHRIVELPATGVLDPDAFRALLRASGVGYVKLLDSLATTQEEG